MLGGWLPILTLHLVRYRPAAAGAVDRCGLCRGGDHHRHRRRQSRCAPDREQCRTGTAAARQSRGDLDGGQSLHRRYPPSLPAARLSSLPPEVPAAPDFSRLSMLGNLLDDAGDHGLDHAGLRNRLEPRLIKRFRAAPSGAVTTVAACSLPASRDTHPPCREHKFSHRYGDEITNWRGCLESLMSGDFLTPTFIGLDLPRHHPVWAVARPGDHPRAIVGAVVRRRHGRDSAPGKKTAVCAGAISA